MPTWTFLRPCAPCSPPTCVEIGSGPRPFTGWDYEGLLHFKARLDAGHPIHAHEIQYPIMQGWDSVMIDADVEMGGSDQLFNNLVGRELQRDDGKDGQVVIVTPLLVGTDGAIKLHAPWYAPAHLSITEPGKSERVIDTPIEGNGFGYQAAEAGACIRAGQLESAILPLEETRSIMRTLDQIRAQWGMKYPFEAPDAIPHS